MPNLTSLRDLLIDELKDLYSAENQLIKALPKMAKAASSPPLKEGFTNHFRETRSHVARLEKAIKLLGESPGGKLCHAMKGLVEEGAEAIETGAPDAVRDANLIGAAQRVEHYEIAAYGTARAFAQTVGAAEVAKLLGETLAEEAKTNQTLTTLSLEINRKANQKEDTAEGGLPPQAKKVTRHRALTRYSSRQT